MSMSAGVHPISLLGDYRACSRLCSRSPPVSSLLRTRGNPTQSLVLVRQRNKSNRCTTLTAERCWLLIERLACAAAKIDQSASSRWFSHRAIVPGMCELFGNTPEDNPFAHNRFRLQHGPREPGVGMLVAERRADTHCP